MFAFLSRLVLFLIALSVLRSVVAFLQRAWAELTGAAPRTSPRSEPRASAEAGTTTVLQQDPVCGTYVAVDTSLKKIVAGKVVHFCSNDCRDRYRA